MSTVPVANIEADSRGRMSLGKWLRAGIRYLVFTGEDGVVRLEPISE